MFHGDRLAGDFDGGPHQATARLTHRGERLREEIVERLVDLVLPGHLGLLQLLVERVALDRVGAAVLLDPEPFHFGAQRVGPLGDDRPETDCVSACTAGVVQRPAAAPHDS